MKNLITVASALLIVAGIAVVVVFLFFRSDQSVDLEDPAGTPVAAGRPDDSAIEEQESPSPATKPIRPRMRLFPSSFPSEGTAAQAEKRPLTGTVVVTDESGSEHCEESGLFSMLLRKGKDLDSQTRVIEGGRWTITVPEGARIEVQEITLGKRLTFIDGEKTITPPETGDVQIRAFWPPRTLLHVKDSATGAELPLVELAMSKRVFNEGDEHPGGIAKTVASGIASPIALAEALGQNVFRGNDSGRLSMFARSQGYAWKNFSLDLRTGGDQTVNLDRGGTLEVMLSGYENRSPSYLYLRKAEPDEQREGEEDLQQEAPDNDIPEAFKRILLKRKKLEGWSVVPTAKIPLRKNGLIRIESLHPGSYLAGAEAGTMFFDSRELGRVVAEVAAGRTTSVDLRVNMPPSQALVPLSGSLHIPAAWKTESFSLSVRLLDPPRFKVPIFQSLRSCEFERQAGKDETVYLWNAGKVQAGLYNLEVDHPRFVTSLTVGPRGATAVQLFVPPPGLVSIQVVDRETREELTAPGLSWFSVSPAGTAIGSPQEIGFDKTTGRFEFKAPLGKICIRFLHDDYRPGGFQDDPFEVRAGENHFTLEADRTLGFLLVVMCGEKVMTWNDNWNVIPIPVEKSDTAEFTSWKMHSEGMRIGVGAPGPYRFDFPHLDGYRPVPTQEVLVCRQEFVRHVITLEPVP
jgi:hypothetical protein